MDICIDAVVVADDAGALVKPIPEVITICELSVNTIISWVRGPIAL